MMSTELTTTNEAMKEPAGCFHEGKCRIDTLRQLEFDTAGKGSGNAYWCTGTGISLVSFVHGSTAHSARLSSAHHNTNPLHATQYNPTQLIHSIEAAVKGHNSTQL
jgi:hypothetical protein